MKKFGSNGMSEELANYETPFADITLAKEDSYEIVSSENYTSNFLLELETPFSKTYDASSSSVNLSPNSNEYIELLGELNDPKFTNTLYELATELEDTWMSKISNEVAMGEKYIPFATQQATEYFAPIYKESMNMIDKISEYFSGQNLSDQSEAEIESLLSNLEFNHAHLSPAQEQFLGGIIDKVKSVVKKGVDLAKKGISAVGKVLPIKIILGKLKGLIKPLLNRVLKFAIGKLPKNLQSHAHALSKKFLNLETSNTTDSYDKNISTSGELETIQYELDNYIAQLVFVPNEAEAESFLMEFETSFETIERNNNYLIGGLNIPPIEIARAQFINDLKSLTPDKSPAPAIEKFLPAAILALQPAIKIAISLIGRQKVINFLANLLAKLVEKYVPENVAQPLAASIIDVGMSAIGFETYELNKTDLAYETIANTIQETIQNLDLLDENSLSDNQSLTIHLLEAFEKAAANNFPPRYIKEELRPSIQPGIWVLKPRNGPRFMYKKFTHVFNVTIDPKTAASVTTFGCLPLMNFLRDKLGLDLSKPINAKVHLYEAINDTWLSRISKYENLPGLNSAEKYSWEQLHPLTPQAASLLLKEPGLGKNVEHKYTVSRHKIAIGQRFYFLEINGARLRMPAVDHSRHHHQPGTTPDTRIPSQSSDIQVVINFIKSEIRFNYYFSEEDSKTTIEKINNNDFVGAAMGLRRTVRDVLQNILIKNIESNVKIIHEAMPELYLENYNSNQENFAPLAALGRAVGGIAVNAGKEVITKIVEKLINSLSELAYNALVNYFKARAIEFKQAQAAPQDGVTVKIIWINIPGMSTIRAIINAIRGNLSVGNLADLVLPNIPTPDIKILPGKNFD